MRIAVFAILVAGAASAADSELERARDKQDRPALDRVAGQYAAGAQAAPKDAEAQYRAALAASYVAEVAIEVKDKEKARRAAESGIGPAERAVAMKPNNGEYYRVLATLYGQVIPANPMAGLSYGKKAKEAIAKALELSPKSAPVHMAEGVGNYYLPAMFGGGPELAIKNFHEAIALDPKSSEAYLWLGIAQKKIHKNVEARQSLAKSLELNPSRVWAKEQLEKDSASVTNWMAALGIAALALYSFFLFPGHTYLTQDTQIYVPILENLWDPTALTRDLLVGRSHVAFTLYDEYAIALRWLTQSSFAAVLQTTQILCRAMGIWGVYLIALSILHRRITSLAVAAVCALGAEVWGPAVLVVEFEPSPRAFAIPLFLLAIGLTAHGRMGWAASAATVGFVIHPTSVAPFWLAFAVLRQWRIALISLLCGVAILLVSACFEPGMREEQVFFARVSAPLEAIQRMRAAYNWIGMWFSLEWWKYLACVAVGATAFWRLRLVIIPELRPFLVGLPALGLLSVPVSYISLDRLKWAAIPQIQPARLLLFAVAIPILLAATAAFYSKRRWEAPLWLALALTPAVAAPRPRIIPTPALAQLSRWAAANTPKNSVFLFPRAAHSLEPGYFRSDALRAVYVDWKSGGQANFLPELGIEWWRRYTDVMTKPQTLEHYRSLGIDYLVFAGDPYRIVKVPAK